MRSRVEFVTGSLCEDDPPQQLLRVNCSEGSSGKNHISQEQIKSDVMCMTGVRSGCCSEEEEVHRKSNLHIMAGCVLQEPLGLQICQTEMEIIIVIIINPEVKKKLVVSLKKCVLLVVIR
jgi:L-ribulose-5-phosphate 3-epimerase UlaE